MKRSQPFFNRSNSSGGLLYSTVISRWSFLQIRAEVAGVEREDRVVLGEQGGLEGL